MGGKNEKCLEDKSVSGGENEEWKKAELKN